MGLVSWIILGGLAGWVASIVMGKDAQMGILANIAVGIVGSLIGGFLMNVILKKPGVVGFNLWSFLVALVGSIVLLAVFKLIRGR